MTFKNVITDRSARKKTLMRACLHPMIQQRAPFHFDRKSTTNLTMLALRRAASKRVATALATPAQTVSFSSDSFYEKERAAEAAYFNKEDERALRKLLKKMKGQADKADASGAKSHIDHDKKGLEKLDLQLSQEQVDALLKWKHEH